ncbi:MAG: von Willebrand factor type A domain-containing protein [Oscillospiraceae bacterium]|nr:von Willebrand factor type A domain-containing protein [Oscillospiraceae bacterium]
MKRKITAITLALSMLASFAPFVTAAEAEKEYSDAIDFVTSNSVMTGDDAGNMNLSDPITRAEFVKMLITAADSEKMDYMVEYYGNLSDPAFSDVPKIHWAYDYIDKAFKLGFIDGVDSEHFCPEDNVTYTQAAKIVLEACGLKRSIGYPFGYISTAMDSSILTGIDFKPDEPITRQDAAQLMYNAYKSVNDSLLSFEQSGVWIDENDPSKWIVGYGLFSSELEIESSSSSTGTSNSKGGSASVAAGSVPMQSDSEAATGSSTSGSGGGGGGGATVSRPSGGSGGGSGVRPSGGVADSPGMPMEPAAPAWEMGGGYAFGYGKNNMFSGEEYESYDPNGFRSAKLSPLSTFSIDTDTASYSNMRRFVFLGQMPQNGSVRTEELINYFEYDTPKMAEDAPFGVTAQLTDCPWSENKLARITVAGAEAEDDKPSNLVFLIDVSGSMDSYNKLPMLKQAMNMLVDNLGENDTVSIVTYASGTRVALEPTNCTEKDKIKSVIQSLYAYGATNGADGLLLAYETIGNKIIDGGNNRIILCSDGDFNVGPSSPEELKTLVTDMRKAGVYLTTMGFGMGNYKDNRMELLADYGNGSYYYIDSLSEAKRVFSDKLDKTLYTVAEDVKLQVEFNPAVVSEYRLVGYENRALAAEDFANDTVDAGELGAGASVTAIYELVLNGDGTSNGDDSTYRYQSNEYKGTDEVLDVKIRYKNPGGSESILKEFPVKNKITAADNDTKFAVAAAMLGLKLNGVIDVSYTDIVEQAVSSLSLEGTYGSDTADRWELVQLTELLKYIDR